MQQHAVIPLYANIRETKKYDVIGFDSFLESVCNGKWQDIVLPIRAIKDKEKRRDAKKKVPNVTLSGIFKDRTDSNAISVTGFIGIDIDDIDPEEIKERLSGDNYIYSIFTSISGTGVCLIFKINPEKHREAFAGISEYLFNKYQLICDPSGVNPARSRFISYDPHLHTYPKVDKFCLYPKQKTPAKIERSVFAQNDFEELINEIQRRSINLCESYDAWLRIAFGFAEQFGENGRNYFHIVSSVSGKYNAAQCEKQFNNCIKAAGSKISTISTFFYYCKQAGLQLYSGQTTTIINAAVVAKKGGRDKDTVISLLKKNENIAPDISAPIIEQVFENDIKQSKDGIISQIEQFIKYEYDLRRNEITRYVENNGKPMKQTDFNTIFIAAKKLFEKISFELIDRIINSDFIPTYNPFIQFFNLHSDRKPDGVISNLFDTILTEDYEYTRYFGTKWLVSIISSIYGQHSPLMLVLSGNIQNTGKTEWLRRLLPDELKPYYAESKLDAGKDDEILMTQKIIIMDDEMGGKSKKDERRLKELLSRQSFSLREPYGRNNVDLNRLAVLCGTTNDEAILSDPTGNRRILPVPVYSISQEDYNKVDKIDVIMEAYNLWKNGFEWQLTQKDIEKLGSKTGRFEKYSAEYELILKFFRMPTKEEEDGDSVEYLMSSEIKNILETRTVQKLSLDRIGKEMQRIGFKQTMKKINNSPRRRYEVIQVATVVGNSQQNFYKATTPN